MELDRSSGFPLSPITHLHSSHVFLSSLTLLHVPPFTSPRLSSRSRTLLISSDLSLHGQLFSRSFTNLFTSPHPQLLLQERERERRGERGRLILLVGSIKDKHVQCLDVDLETVLFHLESSLCAFLKLSIIMGVAAVSNTQVPSQASRYRGNNVG